MSGTHLPDETRSSLPDNWNVVVKQRTRRLYYDGLKSLNVRKTMFEECEACNFILKRQLEIIKPKFILILGRIAASVLLKTEGSIANLRGKVYQISGAQAVVTYHPAALLRNASLKRSTWEDVQMFQKLYQ